MCLPTSPIKTMGDGGLPAFAASTAAAASPIATSKEEIKRPPQRSVTDVAPRRVRFESSPTQSPPSPLNQLADWTEVWYGASDLGGFRDEAREHCRAMRVGLIHHQEQQAEDEYSSDSSSSSSSSSASSSSPSSADRPSSPTEPLLAATDMCRGLEARCCPERQRRKYLTNKCIVRAQTHLSPDQLALLSLKCTAWASALAAREGARDYFRAYSKRCASASSSASEDNGTADRRRVRPRTA